MNPLKDWCAQIVAQTIPTLPGWCYHSKAQRLFELAIREAPLRSIELGVFGGRSMLPLALAHWSSGIGQVIGVDPWTREAALDGKNSPENDTWWGNQDLAWVQEQAEGMLTRLVPPTAWSLSIRTSLAHAADETLNPIRYGLLHQDSNHSEEISCAELAAYRPLMLPGSIWVMDDTQWATLQKVQRIMVEEHGFVLEENGGDWRVYRVPK